MSNTDDELDEILEVLEAEATYSDSDAWVTEDSKAEAKQAILKNYRHIDDIRGAIEDIGNEPMPRKGRSGKYIRSPQSFQDGFEEARVELRQALNTGDK